MKKELIIYGIAGGLLIATLNYVQYKFVLLRHSYEVYAGILALIFTAVGIYLGLKLTRKKEVVVEKEVIVEKEVLVEREVRVEVEREKGPFTLNRAKLDELGLTQREFEILQHIAEGGSNKEIADKLFVSENTIKTHSSRLFDKMNVNRRMQAVQKAKEWGLLPQ